MMLGENSHWNMYECKLETGEDMYLLLLKLDVGVCVE